jgi:hypothetical protein
MDRNSEHYAKSTVGCYEDKEVDFLKYKRDVDVQGNNKMFVGILTYNL